MTIIKLTLLSLVLYVVGIIWFVLLTQDELSHHTYMSENALLTGHVEPEFGNYMYAQKLYTHMQNMDLKKGIDNLRSYLKSEMEAIGMDVGDHKFTLQFQHVFGQNFTGANLCGIVRSPGIARTEALLLHAPLREEHIEKGKPNPLANFAVMLALAKHMRSNTYWAKDLILLFTDMEFVGLQAWLDSYHGVHSSQYIETDILFTRSGSIQVGLSLDYGQGSKGAFELRLPGVNGIMPNLDLINNIIQNAEALNVRTTVHDVASPPDAFTWNSRTTRMKHMLRMMRAQSSGSPSGLHGPLLALEIPSVTILSSGSENLRLNKLSLLLEMTLRSLNNLEERLHQSFFFYLLPSASRYVSIGMYMLPFGCFLASIGIQIFYLWFQFRTTMEKDRTVKIEKEVEEKIEHVKASDSSSGVLQIMKHVCVVSMLALIADISPEYAISMAQPFQVEPAKALLIAFGSFQTCAIAYPYILNRKRKVTVVDANWHLTKCLLLIIWGITLGCLSIINISMATFFAIAVVPVLVLIQPSSSRLIQLFLRAGILLVSPFVLLLIAFTLAESATTSIIMMNHLLVNAYVEQCLLKSWTLHIGCLVILPAWTLLWGLAPLKSENQMDK